MEVANCYITEFYPRGIFGESQTQIDSRRTIMETIQEEEEEEKEEEDDDDDKDEKEEYLFNI